MHDLMSVMIRNPRALGFASGAIGVALLMTAAPPAHGLTELPFTFVENRGQWDEPVRFVARARDMIAYLEPGGVTLQLTHDAALQVAGGVEVGMTFEGASGTASLTGEDRQPGVHNFFLGNDRTRWRHAVPGYGHVDYHDVYDGVDVRVREASGRLEYDLRLRDGADLDQVVIRCEGIDGLEVHPDGSLAMETALGPIRQSPPTTWYELPSGERRPVHCRFRKIDPHRYGFEVPERDPSLALVIDPVVEWSTYLGNTGHDGAFGVALDPSGSVIVAGFTGLPFSRTPGDHPQRGSDQRYDWFVASLAPAGDTLLWWTTLGGSGSDWAYGVGLDDAGRVIVAGLTSSPDFPVTPGAFDTHYDDPSDGAVACLDADGTLEYATYLGGAIDDWISDLAVDGSGEAIVVGYTESGNFPTTPGAHDTELSGLADAFVTRLNAGGTGLVYSTFLGGSGTEGIEYLPAPDDLPWYQSVALHASGDVLVGGTTSSIDFPTTPGAFDRKHDGDFDGFVTRLNADGSDLVYSTLLGAGGFDAVRSIAVDTPGVVTVGGFTNSVSFPTTPGAYDEIRDADRDGFVARLSETGADLLYSTFIGGQFAESVDAIALDGSGEVIGAGYTSSPDFPTTPDAYDGAFNGFTDVVLFQLTPDGNGPDDLRYATFLGGPFLDGAGDLAVDSGTGAVLVGYGADGFPVTAGAHDVTHGNPGDGKADGFVCRFQDLRVDVPAEGVVDGVPAARLGPVAPNPTDGRLGYRIDLTAAAVVRIHLFDVSGRRVRTLLDQRMSAGVHDLSVRLEGGPEWLPNGVYYLRLDADGVQRSRRFVLAR